MEQLDGSLDDVESGERLSLRGQLLPGLVLEVEALSVDGVELCFER